MSITPKNWNTFQHYKDRAPAWIKLHRGLLDDYAFHCLPVASKALAPCLWLLASEYDDGKITASFDEIAFRFRMTKNEVCEAINPLIEAGFFVVASETLAECKRDAIPEKRESKRESSIEPSGSPSDEAEFFRRGKELLGPSSGGLLAKIKKNKGSIPLARAALELASTKENPREYLGRILSGPAPPEKVLSPFGTEYPDGIL